MVGIQAGTFLRDLFYRLQVFRLLASRGNDQRHSCAGRILVDHCARKAERTYSDTISLDLLRATPARDIRELQDVIELICLMC